MTEVTHEGVSGPSNVNALLSRPAQVYGQSAAMRILLADDHEMVRDTIAAYLETEGRAAVVSDED